MLKALLILIVGTLFLSSLLTPAVYSTLLYFFPDLPWPFSRVYDRVAMLAVAVLLYLMRRQFSLSSLARYFKREELALKFRSLFFGFLCTLLMTLLFLPLFVGQGPLLWADHDTNYYLYKIAKVIPAALLISLIEESFFRVLLFDKIKEKLSVLLSAIVCSAVYAGVHFITPAKSYLYPGFYCLPARFQLINSFFHHKPDKERSGKTPCDLCSRIDHPAI